MIEYLSREDQGRLTVILRDDFPPLIEDLAAAIAKPYEAINYQPRVSTGEKTQPLPYDPSAEDAHRYLHAELLRWVEWLATERHLDTQVGTWTTPALARWLLANIITLATTPGSEWSYANIASEVKAAQRATGRQQRAQRIQPNEAQSAEVRAMELSPSGIATAAKELGHLGRGLTRTRVNNLKARGHITPIRTIPNGKKAPIPIYAFGAVLDAHLTTEQRTTA